MDRLKNTTKKGVISWYTIGDVEEHYKEHRPKSSGRYLDPGSPEHETGELTL